MFSSSPSRPDAASAHADHPDADLLQRRVLQAQRALCPLGRGGAASSAAPARPAPSAAAPQAPIACIIPRREIGWLFGVDMVETPFKTGGLIRDLERGPGRFRPLIGALDPARFVVRDRSRMITASRLNDVPIHEELRTGSRPTFMPSTMINRSGPSFWIASIAPQNLQILLASRARRLAQQIESAPLRDVDAADPLRAGGGTGGGDEKQDGCRQQDCQRSHGRVRSK